MRREEMKRNLLLAFMVSAAGCGMARQSRFVEDNGLLCIEAESFSEMKPSTFRKYEHVHEWRFRDDREGFSGSGFMQVLPDERPEDKNGPGSPRDNSGSELSYPVRITSEGTYYVYVRGMSMGGESNGIHVGVDGELAGMEAGASNMSGFRPHDQWCWENRRKEGYAEPATLVLTRGDHTLNVWNRDDGFRFDKIVLTLSEARPEGTGPEESRRIEE
jgi:hypothetical protein